MVSTRKGTYETPPPKPSRRRPLSQEVADADATPSGDLDSDSYWSGSDTANSALAVASSNSSASVLSGDSTKGESGGSPEATSIGSAGGRIDPDLLQSVVSSSLRSIAIPRTSLPSMAIGSLSWNETGISSGHRDALEIVAASSVNPEPDITSSSSTAIGLTSSRDETGLLLSCAQAPSSASASVSIAASSVIPAPDKSSVVTAGDDRRVIVAGTNSVFLPSFEPSADITYHVPENIVNQFVLPKRFARHVPDSVNNLLDTSARFFPLWFRQSIETGQDATETIDETQDPSGADSNSDMFWGTMVLYTPPLANRIQCCAVITEVPGDPNQEAEAESSKKAGKRRQKSRSKSHKSSRKASDGSGKSAPKSPGNHDHISRGLPSTSTSFNREDSVPRGGYFYRSMSNGPPDLPSSSSSSSSDSSSETSDPESSAESSSDSPPYRPSVPSRASVRKKASKKRDGDRSKDLTKLLRSVKIKSPFVYDGTADFDKFEQWTYEVDTWIDFNSIPARWAVRLIAAFVSGPASEYFMDFVATDHGSFKMKQIYSGLFEYCFPVEIRRNMRRDLLSARQRDNEKIRNFIRRITRLSKRLGDVSDRQVIQIVWDGALSYLRLKWADSGFDFETSSLPALENAAKGYEVAETIRRIEAAKRAAEASSKAGSQYSVKSSASGVSSNTSTKKSRLTQEERDQFRAENR
ncbi:hypothetical protein B0H14DRAFT_3536089 [Mycena olivaceomarginata]|nr:hypothetical protein B0H14DRAFT_3536089 [Mycena olivaceomarginata]